MTPDGILGRAIFVFTAAAFSFSSPYYALEAPKAKRFETINFANLMAPVGTPYVAPGKTKEYYVYGPWVDFADSVTFRGARQIIVERRGAGADGGLLRVKLTGSGARGRSNATIKIKCPPIPFTDCVNGNITFPVMVLGVGTLTRIDPDTVDANSRRTFRIDGTGLDNATVFLFRTDLKAIADESNSATRLTFTATSTGCGTNRVRVRDVAEGGDFYPFPGGLDVRLTTSCGYVPITSGATISGGSTAPTPDLQPIPGTVLLRHISPNRKLSGELFCNSMFAQAVQSIVRTITVPNMVWGVKNAGPGNVTTAFRVRLYRNGVLVRDEQVSSLSAGASATFTYVRPQSQTDVARLGITPPATTMQLYNATGGECVQTAGQDAQFDWQDPTYEIRVDPAGAVVSETNKSNNNRTF